MATHGSEDTHADLPLLPILPSATADEDPSGAARAEMYRKSAEWKRKKSKEVRKQYNRNRRGYRAIDVRVELQARDREYKPARKTG